MTTTTTIHQQPTLHFDDQYMIVVDMIAERYTERKFDASEMTTDLIRFATEWAIRYEGSFSFMLDMQASARRGLLSPGKAKGTLNCLRADVLRGGRKTTRKAEVTVTAEGMYQDPDADLLDPAIGEELPAAIWKVQVSGAGRPYAKQLMVRREVPSERHPEGQLRGRFEYAQGAVFNLKPEWKMTLEEAKGFGRLYGICCVCAAELADATSIANGIGPVCGGKGHWVAADRDAAERQLDVVDNDVVEASTGYDADPEVAFYQRHDGWV
jgi:hypothetical protein